MEGEIQNINEEKIFVILSIFIQFFVFYLFPVWTAREIDNNNKNGQFLFDYFLNFLKTNGGEKYIHYYYCYY